MKHIIALMLAMVFIGASVPASADFTVRVFMERETPKGPELWPKPLVEFQVEGNELTTKEFDKRMYRILQRGMSAQQETKVLRMEISFMADGDFKFVSEDYMPSESFFQKLGLTLAKKHYGQIIWYSRNGEPWIEIASNERLRKIRKVFEVFHDGGRVDLRTYFTAGKDVGFKIESAGPLVAVEMDKQDIKPVDVNLAEYTHGYSSRTQYFTYDLKSEMYIDKPYAERNILFTEAPPVFNAPNLSEADARWTAYQVVHFGLVVDAPGFVQLAYMPNQSNKGSSVHDKEQLSKSFFVANQGGDWKFLESEHIGHGKWIIFNAPKAGVYEMALYIEREESKGSFGSAEGSVGGSFLYQEPYSNIFRPLELGDVVQIGSGDEVEVEEGLYIGGKKLRGGKE